MLRISFIKINSFLSYIFSVQYWSFSIFRCSQSRLYTQFLIMIMRNPFSMKEQLTNLFVLGSFCSTSPLQLAACLRIRYVSSILLYQRLKVLVFHPG